MTWSESHTYSYLLILYSLWENKHNRKSSFVLFFCFFNERIKCQQSQKLCLRDKTDRSVANRALQVPVETGRERFLYGIPCLSQGEDTYMHMCASREEGWCWMLHLAFLRRKWDGFMEIKAQCLEAPLIFFCPPNVISNDFLRFII